MRSSTSTVSGRKSTSRTFPAVAVESTIVSPARHDHGAARLLGELAGLERDLGTADLEGDPAHTISHVGPFGRLRLAACALFVLLRTRPMLAAGRIERSPGLLAPRPCSPSRRSSERRWPRSTSTWRAERIVPSGCSQKSVQVSCCGAWVGRRAREGDGARPRLDARVVDHTHHVATRSGSSRAASSKPSCRSVAPLPEVADRLARRVARPRRPGRPSCRSRSAGVSHSIRNVALALSMPVPLGTVIRWSS